MTTASPPDQKIDAKTLRIAGVVVLGAIMSILDTTVVSVAQDTFQKTFDSGAATVAWTATGYTLALAAVIPVAGWAATKFGTKRVYLTSLVLFILGSLACAIAWDITSLVVFRVLQGLGGGMLMPVGMMIMTRAAGPGRLGSVMAILGIPMLLGPICGPILGGWLIEIASWHWVFLINLPIGIIALVYAWIVLEHDESHEANPFDVIGLLLLSPGLASFLYGVSTSAEERTFASAKVIVPMAIGILLVIVFIRHAFRSKNPLIDLRLFRNRTLTVSVVTLSVFMIAFFGAMLMYPLYFIQVRHETTLWAGLLIAPQGVGAMLTMPIAGRMTDRIGPGKFVLTGIGLITLGMLTFTQLSSDTSYALICGALFVQGLGMGMTMMPMMSSALATLRPAEVANGSTLTNVVQQIAGSIGVAVTMVILQNNMTDRIDEVKENPDLLAAAGKAAQTAGAQAAQAAAAGGASPADAAAASAKAAEAAAMSAADPWTLPAIADGMAATFIVTIALVAVAFLPALFLPRTRITPEVQAGDEAAAPVIMH